MKITTLKAAPHLYEATLSLIESAFAYEKPNSFAVDFAPLMDESNFSNCFIMLDEEDTVIAHIGVCEREILGVNFAMLGGIAVDETRRGEGIFQDLMSDVLAEKRSEVAFFILWSDQEKLYKKFGFHLCGTQIEIPQSPGKKLFTQTKLHLLSEKQKSEVRELFEKSFSTLYTTPPRSSEDWDLLSTITSADTFIREEDGKVTSYFMMNKGQDLTGIIYEYGTLQKFEQLIPQMSAYGNVWLGSDFVEAQEMQYQFFMSPGDKKLFGSVVEKMTNGKMVIEGMNSVKQEVYFHFNDELLSLETEDFLRGMLGPGIFEEIADELKPLFISGLVSI